MTKKAMKSKSPKSIFKTIIEKMMRTGEILRNIGIQNRLIGAFLLISIIPLGITGFTSYRNSNNAIKDKIETYSVQLMKQLGNNIIIELNKLEAYGKDIINSTEVQNLADFSDLEMNERLTAGKAAQNAILKRIEPVQSYINLAEIVIDDGRDDMLIVGAGKEFYDKSSGGNTVLKQNNDILKKYIEASIDINGRLYVGFDDITGYGENIILARMARSNSSSGGEIGTLIFSVNPDYLLNVYEDLNMGDEAQTFVIDNNGMVLSSKENSEIGSVYREMSLIERIKHDESTNNTQAFTIDIGGEPYLTAYQILGDTEWYVVSTIPYSYLNNESNNIRNNIILWGLICFLGALALSYLVTWSISSPLNRIVKQMNEARTGYLAVEIRDNWKDEIAVVSKSFKEMLSNIRELILSFNESANAVQQNSEKIAMSSLQLRKSYEISSNIIHQIAAGSCEQAEGANSCVEYMDDLSDSIDRMKDDTSHISELVVKTKTLSEDTCDVINILKDKASQTSSVSERIACEINSLNNDMKEIKSIIKLIAGISEQTNLLSLNASIEAARAGEAGRGFTVVAEEVKKLADQSKEASASINNIINNIQKKTDQVVTMANDSGSIIKEQMEAVIKTDEAFKTVFNAMKNVSSSIDNTSNTTRKVIVSRQKTLEAIGDISSVSEETAATVEEVTAGIAENLDGIQSLAESAGELKDMASRLKTAIEKFRV